MTSLLLASAMFLPVSASEEETETYAAAYRAIVESGKPMVVMVGSEACPPCQAMKRHILPELRKRRCFNEIVFARVNADDEAALAKRLTGGGPIPQLIMFRKTENGWARRKLIGRQSIETVERFVEQGLALAASDRQPDAARLAALPVGETAQ